MVAKTWKMMSLFSKLHEVVILLKKTGQRQRERERERERKRE